MLGDEKLPKCNSRYHRAPPMFHDGEAPSALRTIIAYQARKLSQAVNKPQVGEETRHKSSPDLHI